MSTPIPLKSLKQKLTRQLNALGKLIKEAEVYSPTWTFPTQITDFKQFAASHKNSITTLKQEIADQADKIEALYDLGLQNVHTTNDKTAEEAFNEYWEERDGDAILSLAITMIHLLTKRLSELLCQESLANEQNNTTVTTRESTELNNQEILTRPLQSLTLDQGLLNNQLKVPEFHGDPTEFGPFWELFDELVHKQPYSNICKLSILLNCCKGDAARSLRMIPRTGEAYEKAIQQLRDQYEDPKRITIQMIRQLKSMKSCRDDPRTLRNTLSDVQAIIATLERQGEVVDCTHMTTMVIETFPQTVQDEIARKEFDNGTQWTMENLIKNLTTIIKRREHIDSRNDKLQEQQSVFHTQTYKSNISYCAGCGRAHRFEQCDKYRTVQQKIARLKALNACWKCFSPNHRSIFCSKPNCYNCGGYHHSSICLSNRQPSKPIMNTRFHPRRRSTTPNTRQRQLRPQDNFERNNRQRLSNYPYRSSVPPRRNTQHEASVQPRPLSPIQSEATVPAQFTTHRPGHSTQSRTVKFAPPSRDNSTAANVYLQARIPSQQKLEKKFIHQSNTDNVARLMIVSLRVRNPYSTKEKQAYALLDSASDQSFITTSLADYLQLTPHTETTITVHTFGGHAEKKRVRHVETLLLNSEGQSMKANLLTNDTITQPLTLHELNLEDKRFLEHKFPNYRSTFLYNFTTDVIPDILLGIDYFYTILQLNEPIVQLPSGLFVTSTIFGPVISGTLKNKQILEPNQDYTVSITTLTSEYTDEKEEHYLDCSDPILMA